MTGKSRTHIVDVREQRLEVLENFDGLLVGRHVIIVAGHPILEASPLVEIFFESISIIFKNTIDSPPNLGYINYIMFKTSLPSLPLLPLLPSDGMALTAREKESN